METWLGNPYFEPISENKTCNDPSVAFCEVWVIPVGRFIDKPLFPQTMIFFCSGALRFAVKRAVYPRLLESAHMIHQD
jgi:hypothetical protein